MPINVDDIVVDFECPECKLTQQTTVRSRMPYMYYM